jgi:G3E family GTPase
LSLETSTDDPYNMTTFRIHFLDSTLLTKTDAASSESLEIIHGWPSTIQNDCKFVEVKDRHINQALPISSSEEGVSQE